ncbi:MAG: glycosyltransferase family 2 protein, partial [Magnetococcales bacterium]|nr:glycosyltransferase family 2 protein [Magnetococcales bacterium]
MNRDSDKLPISVAIITLNEQNSLADCLASAAFAQDIVVVDSGSTDTTVELAESMGARVFHQPWLGYGAQKNVAVDQARFDWVLCLDADERVDSRLSRNIRQVMTHRNHRYVGYRMARRNFFLGRGLKHGFGYPDYKLRLMHRKQGRWTNSDVHEYIEVDGPVGLLDGDLLHYSGESLQQYLEKHNRYTTLQANSL